MKKIGKYITKCKMLGIKPLRVEVRDNGKIEINNYDDEIDRCLIPNFATSIGPCAFEMCKELKQVDLPKSIRVVGDLAFRLSGLRSIDLCNTERVGLSAFEGCYKLKSVRMSDNVKELGGYLFNMCGLLENINIPSKVTELQDYTFNGCSSIKEINLDNIRYIGKSCFCGCKSLTRVEFGKDIEIIGKMAFVACEGIEEIKFNSLNVEIGEECFKGCYNIKRVIMPKGCKITHKYLFIPSNVEFIYV